MVSHVEGEAYVGNVSAGEARSRYAEVKDNEVVYTRWGRAEILLGPWRVLWIGENSSFRMVSTRLTDTRIELLAGSAVVEAGTVPKSAKLTVMLQSAAIETDRRGLYRFDLTAPAFQVLGGKALIRFMGRTVSASAGKTIRTGCAGEPAAIRQAAD